MTFLSGWQFLQMKLLSLFAVILSLILVIGLHEAGHAWAARCFRVKIKSISIGFGRPLIAWQGRSGCRWVWRLWPLGGAVHLLNTRIAPVSPQESLLAFDKKSIWVRCVILLSGAVANILLAWFALTFMLMLGYQQFAPILKEVKTPSIAATAGLLAGDNIIAVAHQNTSSWREVNMQLIMNLGHSHVDVLVKAASGRNHHVWLDLKQWQYRGGKEPLLAALGLKPDLTKTRVVQKPPLTLWPAFRQAWSQMVFLLKYYIVMLKQLLLGAIPFALLLGPLGLFSVILHSFFQGLAVFLFFIANLSIAVAFINLLPIPGLDGGAILYALIEKCRGKPLSVAMEILLYQLAMIMAGIFLIQLLLNDARVYVASLLH